MASKPAALVLALGLLLAATGCASSRGDEGWSMPLDPMDATPNTGQTQTTFLGSVANTLLAIPETALWIPYKIVTSTLNGAYNGVVDGVGRSGFPVIGVLTSPLTAAAGAVKGALTGVTTGPWVIGSTAEFGQALARPWGQPIHLWGPR